MEAADRYAVVGPGPDADRVALVHSGEDYFGRLLRLIGEAEAELHLQTYIFDDDATGRQVIGALKAAAQRQVAVYVLVDGFGSGGLGKAARAELTAAGVHVRIFSPWLSFNTLYLGRRLHHKVAVADGRVALVGGINIADKYHGTATDRAWLDFAVELDSPVLGQELARLCKSFYLRQSHRRRKRLLHDGGLGPGTSIKILQNDFLLRKNEVFTGYMRALRAARESAVIVGSYFLPGRRFARVLARAARRGVAVRLILAGISDVPMVRRATCHLYGRLLRQGIGLYEWNASVVHGKSAVFDGGCATVGSFNLNSLSAYGSVEMNVEVTSAEFGAVVAADLEAVIAQCEEVTLAKLQLREGWLERLRNWAAYRIMRLSMRVMTFLPSNRWWASRFAPPKRGRPA